MRICVSLHVFAGYGLVQWLILTLLELTFSDVYLSRKRPKTCTVHKHWLSLVLTRVVGPLFIVCKKYVVSSIQVY